MNRIDRLTAIIIFLQGRQRVTVDELADRYDISTRTVYRDLRALQEAGVPIGSEEGAGYYIVKGYHYAHRRRSQSTRIARENQAIERRRPK